MRILMLVVALSMCCTLATAAPADAPKRKSGVWEITVVSAEMGGQRPMPLVQQCIDQKTDDFWEDQLPDGGKAVCSKNEIRREGGRIVADSVCKVEGTTATTRAVFTGSFDTAYQVDVKSSFQPPLNGAREASLRIEAKWLGPCKPEQKPGDIILPWLPGKK